MIDFKNADLFLKSDTKKEILIEYSGGIITNSELHQNTFSLEESLCSEESLRFGACEASILKFTVHNTVIPFKNEWIDVSMILNGNTSEPFEIGHYKVYSDVPTADRKKRNVVAYDALYDILQAEVSDWYNDLLPEETSTVTLREFRNSFFEYVGAEQEETSLVNDSMIVAKTIQPEQLSGKNVINCICEINGCFGHVGRDGKFKYVYIEQSIKGLYPSQDLYPSNDLFPMEPKGKLIGTGSYIPPVIYSDFTVKGITGLTIREEEGSIGCNVGELSNVYVIQDNFIVYGKGTEELEGIGRNILSKIKDITYIPFNTKAKANPCIEVGDPIRVRTKEKRIDTYVLQRTITGVKSQRDYYEATGEEKQKEKVNSISNSIIQLKGKTNKLTRTIEETRLEMTDIEKGLISTISITAGQIRAEVFDLKDELNSSILQTASQIRSEVSDSNKDLQSQITQNAGSITSEITRAKNAENQLSSRITQTEDSVNITINSKTEEVRDYFNSTITNYYTKTETETKIGATKDNILLSVSTEYETISGANRAYEELEAKIQVNSDKIALKVSSSKVQTMIDLSLEELVLSSSQIRLEGYTTINGGFAVDEDGNATLGNSSARAYMSGSYFWIETSSGDSAYIGPTGLAFDGSFVISKGDKVYVTCEKLSADSVYINGYRAIHAGNIDSYLDDNSYDDSALWDMINDILWRLNVLENTIDGGSWEYIQLEGYDGNEYAYNWFVK